VLSVWFSHATPLRHLVTKFQATGNCFASRFPGKHLPGLSAEERESAVASSETCLMANAVRIARVREVWVASF